MELNKKTEIIIAVVGVAVSVIGIVIYKRGQDQANATSQADASAIANQEDQLSQYLQSLPNYSDASGSSGSAPSSASSFDPSAGGLLSTQPTVAPANPATSNNDNAQLDQLTNDVSQLTQQIQNLQDTKTTTTPNTPGYGSPGNTPTIQGPIQPTPPQDPTTAGQPPTIAQTLNTIFTSPGVIGQQAGYASLATEGGLTVDPTAVVATYGNGVTLDELQAISLLNTPTPSTAPVARPITNPNLPPPPSTPIVLQATSPRSGGFTAPASPTIGSKPLSNIVKGLTGGL